MANLADEIAYYSHDLDDGLESGLLNENQLSASVEAWRLAKKHVEQQFGVLEKEAKHFYVIRCLIDGMVRDVVTSPHGDSSQRACEMCLRCEPLLCLWLPIVKHNNSIIWSFGNI